MAPRSGDGPRDVLACARRGRWESLAYSAGGPRPPERPPRGNAPRPRPHLPPRKERTVPRDGDGPYGPPPENDAAAARKEPLPRPHDQGCTPPSEARRSRRTHVQLCARGRIRAAKSRRSSRPLDTTSRERPEATSRLVELLAEQVDSGGAVAGEDSFRRLETPLLPAPREEPRTRNYRHSISTSP